MANEKNPPNSVKQPSLYLNREPPVSRLHCTVVAVFSLSSLMNPTLYTGFGL
jgi:hypothetical protein